MVEKNNYSNSCLTSQLKSISLNSDSQVSARFLLAQVNSLIYISTSKILDDFDLTLGGFTPMTDLFILELALYTFDMFSCVKSTMEKGYSLYFDQT